MTEERSLYVVRLHRPAQIYRAVVIKETAEQYHVMAPTRKQVSSAWLMKDAPGRRYFNTYAEARRYILDQAEARLKKAQEEVEAANAHSEDDIDEPWWSL